MLIRVSSVAPSRLVYRTIAIRKLFFGRTQVALGSVGGLLLQGLDPEIVGNRLAETADCSCVISMARAWAFSAGESSTSPLSVNKTIRSVMSGKRRLTRWQPQAVGDMARPAKDSTFRPRPRCDF